MYQQSTHIHNSIANIHYFKYKIKRGKWITTSLYIIYIVYISSMIISNCIVFVKFEFKEIISLHIRKTILTKNGLLVKLI